jgi:DNA-dependent RNA polymerase auxiliary subunit epsilon
MKNLVLLFILVIFSSGYVFSQGLQGKKVTVKASSSGYGEKFYLETSCFENEIKIKFKLKDSVARYTMESDSTYKVYFKALLEQSPIDYKSDTLISTLKVLDAVRTANTVYDIDSVTITSDEFPAYKKLLSKLFSSSLSEIENTEYNNKRLVLDGTRIELEVFENGSTLFTANAQSPRKLSHPLLFEYITDTLGIFRKLSKGNFSPSYKTGGY